MPCKALVLITTFPILMLCLMFGRQQLDRPVLAYCCNSMYVSKNSLKTMERFQTKLLKAGVGLHKYC